MNKEQRAKDRWIVVDVTVHRWTGETLLVERVEGPTELVQERLRWVLNHPRVHLPVSTRRSPPKHSAGDST
jgi:hypothetical protein